MHTTLETDAVAARPLGPGDDPVTITADQIHRPLRERFGLAVQSVQALGAESAAVFRVEVENTAAVAVKAFWADDASTTAVRWHHEVVDRLAKDGLPVAHPRPSLDGDLTVEHRVGGRAVLLQVSDWLSGTPLESAPVTRALLAEVGRVAARLHLRLRRETAPPGLGEHAWQITRSKTSIEQALATIAALREGGSVFVTAEEAARLSRAADRVLAAFDGVVAPRMDRLPTALVHHDLHDANLLVGPESAPTAVTGILDFGDMTHSIHISEPIIAGAYAARHRLDPVRAVRAVVDGWSETVPVTGDEAAVVLPLAAARLITNAAVWTSRSGTARADYALARRHRSLETAEALVEEM